MTIKKVAVVGAGTMGSGIAGQVANAGVEVWLLDLPTDGEGNPNRLSERGLERLRETQGLMSQALEKHINIGNTRDDFHQLADCDWVAEAVVERLDIKKELYRKIDEVCGDDTMVSSNTSTIPIKLLVEDMPLSFRKRFAITHFFNPVRFMPLLELVRGEDTEQSVMDALGAFCDKELGKGVIDCLDTPGFLGNRVGCFAIQAALQAAFDLGLSPSQADAIFGRPMGIPKTGVFGLYDLIGIDLMSDVAQSLVNTLPSDDPFHQEAFKQPLMQTMIAKGQTGNKQGRGFYRNGENGREVVDLRSGKYQAAPRLNLDIALKAERDGVRHLLDDDGIYGEFAWRVLSRTLSYAASLVPEVGTNPVGIDDAMKLGYNWIKGPFELIDEIGVDYLINRLNSTDLHVPDYLQQAAGSSFYRVENAKLQVRSYIATGEQPDSVWLGLERDPGVIRFNESRRALSPENSCEVASWFKLQDDIALVEFHSKANALDGDSMAILSDAISHVESGICSGLIVHNDAQHFSCGVNLQAVRGFFLRDDMTGLDAFLNDFQQTVWRMSRLKQPVVCAPVGMSLGGGFEVVLHAKQVICHANSVMGLVESGVGLIPAGGGCKETLYRWHESFDSKDIDKAAWKAFMNLGYGRTCTSPILAVEQAMLRSNDSHLSNRDRLLNAAIEAVTNNSAQKSFERPDLAMAGIEVFNAMQEWLARALVGGKLTPHNVVVATELARIVTGGEVAAGMVMSEQDLFDAERTAFLKLVQTPATQERINSMLDAGAAVQN